MAPAIPFQIAVPDSLLSFIHNRVSTARLPSAMNVPSGQELPGAPPSDWALGPPRDTIERLRAYWAEKYDWRAVEARINAKLRMFTMEVEEAGERLNVHFVHHVSTREGAVPLLFQHGWPGNFLEVEKIIDLLTDPPEGEQAYHVVAPSLPGFVFSDCPKSPEFLVRQTAAVIHKVMIGLGYNKYMAQGGDWGSMVLRVLAMDYPEHLVALHVNMLSTLPPRFFSTPFSWAYFYAWAIGQVRQGAASSLGRTLWWIENENGYLDIQGTKPMALAYALVDSPVGMLAWIRDKMHPLVEEDGFKWEDEEIITWTMLYLIPGSSGHANIYRNTKGKNLEKFYEVLMYRKIPYSTDFGASRFPKDIHSAPRFWASATVADNITFWKDHSSGGHFAATEKPKELVEDIREFTKVFKPAKLALLRESGKVK